MTLTEPELELVRGIREDIKGMRIELAGLREEQRGCREKCSSNVVVLIAWKDEVVKTLEDLKLFKVATTNRLLGGFIVASFFCSILSLVGGAVWTEFRQRYIKNPVPIASVRP